MSGEGSVLEETIITSRESPVCKIMNIIQVAIFDLSRNFDGFVWKRRGVFFKTRDSHFGKRFVPL